MALSELQEFAEVVPMIMGTGVQFLDFGFSIDKQFPAVQDWGFFDQKKNGQVGKQLPPCVRRGDEELRVGVVESYSLDVKAIVEMVHRVWMPIPLLRREAQGYFRGPINWARGYLVQLDEPDADGNAFRLVVAVDTTLIDFMEDEAYLAPSPLDARNGREFALPSPKDAIDWYFAQDWLQDWCFEVFKEMKESKERVRRKFNFRPRSDKEIYEEEMEGDNEHLARYKSFVELLYGLDILPRLKLVDRMTEPQPDPIDVDLVLDLGNSRSCGLLIESDADHLGVDISKSVKLEVRDLGRAEQTYADPFPSRFEFARAGFGLGHLSERSGRSGAFGWPTVVRVGVEAARLAAHRLGSEGASGLSSPKRYLWDEDDRRDSWRFNAVSTQEGMSDIATGVAFTTLVNDSGTALHRIGPEAMDQNASLGFPAMQAFYSRRNLTAFALSEIFVQAMSMMNSPKHRMRRAANANLPRRLRRIIMTMPTAMPLAERRILEEQAEAAVELAYLSMGLATPVQRFEGEDPLNQSSRLYYSKEVAVRHGTAGASDFPGGPEVILQWDEATATQAVYLYTQIALNYSGDARSFFDAVRHPVNQHDPATRDACRLATIDLGGGTTDLVVTSIVAEGSGANVTIFPHQEFREGFNLAGDDALLRVVREHVVEPIKKALRDAGLGDAADYALNHIVGGDRGDMKAIELVRRQQFAAQIAAPIALGMLADYESFDPMRPAASNRRKFSEFFGKDNAPGEGLIEYVNAELSKKGGRGFRFQIEDMDFEVDVLQIDRTIRAVFTEMLRAMGEIVHRYRCDLLILSGRASRLPAVRQILEECAALPSHRLVSLHQFRVGQWYPFRDHKSTVGDPKTTAAVGAMVCLLGNGQLQNFNFRADQLLPRSTARYFGKLDQSNRLRKADEFYTDLDLDNRDYEVPSTAFEFRGPMPLGFRQIEADWWPATRLYSIDYDSPDAARRLHVKTPLNVVLKRHGRKREDVVDNPELQIKSIKAHDGNNSGITQTGSLKLRLQTINQSQGYWLDTGILLES